MKDKQEICLFIQLSSAWRDSGTLWRHWLITVCHLGLVRQHDLSQVLGCLPLSHRIILHWKRLDIRKEFFIGSVFKH